MVTNSVIDSDLHYQLLEIADEELKINKQEETTTCATKIISSVSSAMASLKRFFASICTSPTKCLIPATNPITDLKYQDINGLYKDLRELKEKCEEWNDKDESSNIESMTSSIKKEFNKLKNYKIKLENKLTGLKNRNNAAITNYCANNNFDNLKSLKNDKDNPKNFYRETTFLKTNELNNFEANKFNNLKTKLDNVYNSKAKALQDLLNNEVSKLERQFRQNIYKAQNATGTEALKLYKDAEIFYLNLQEIKSHYNENIANELENITVNFINNEHYYKDLTSKMEIAENQVTFSKHLDFFINTSDLFKQNKLIESMSYLSAKNELKDVLEKKDTKTLVRLLKELEPTSLPQQEVELLSDSNDDDDVFSIMDNLTKQVNQFKHNSLETTKKPLHTLVNSTLQKRYTSMLACTSADQFDQLSEKLQTNQDAFLYQPIKDLSERLKKKKVNDMQQQTSVELNDAQAGDLAGTKITRMIKENQITYISEYTAKYIAEILLKNDPRKDIAASLLSKEFSKEKLIQAKDAINKNLSVFNRDDFSNHKRTIFNVIKLAIKKMKK